MSKYHLAKTKEFTILAAIIAELGIRETKKLKKMKGVLKNLPQATRTNVVNDANMGVTLMHYAVANKAYHIAAYLHAHYFLSLSTPDISGITPYHIIANQGQDIPYLLKYVPFSIKEQIASFFKPASSSIPKDVVAEDKAQRYYSVTRG